MTKHKTGFTLIELMIVVAIVGILVAVAIPIYQRYTIRTQVTEGINLSSGAKVAVADYYMNTGDWPTNNSAAGLSTPTQITGEYTAQVSVSSNVIQIEYGNSAHSKINGQSVTLTGAGNGGSVSWTCASAGAIDDNNLPPVCR